MQEPIELANEKARVLIGMAEAAFGPMSSDWSFGGVLFQDYGPHLSYLPMEGLVNISLSNKAKEAELQMDFQLAHEVCHLLWPAASFRPRAEYHEQTIPNTNVINEGVATYFSVLILNHYYGRESAQEVLLGLHNTSPDYFIAFELVSDLMNKDANAIKRIRKTNPMINSVTIEDVRSAGLEISDDLAYKLTQPFSEL